MRNGHFNTIWSYLKRKTTPLPFQIRTVHTPDGDFMQLNEWKSGNPRCALLIHGLEGNAHSAYILSLARVLQKQGWDIAAPDLRGCSSIPNLAYRMYNSGATDDLSVLVNDLSIHYKHLLVVGFSLGGNITLRYMGEKGALVPSKVVASIAISVPCHLSSSSDQMEKKANWLYSYRFLVSLKAKLRQKLIQFSERKNTLNTGKIHTIRQFDDAYTGPSNGYANGEEYYENCSCLYVLNNIQRPTLLINALDDPFLTPGCFPFDEAKENPHFHFYASRFGGHVGFFPEKGKQLFQHEEWILKFLSQITS